MIELFYLEKENYSKVKNTAEKDDLISRQSLTFREASSLGSDKDGFYFKINGSEESIKKVKELLKDFLEEVENKQEILNKIEEQENQADSGFGNIFG